MEGQLSIFDYPQYCPNSAQNEEVKQEANKLSQATPNCLICRHMFYNECALDECVFEEKKSCRGCMVDKGKKWSVYCFEDGCTCYRYPFNPGVKTITCVDKYISCEEVKK